MLTVYPAVSWAPRGRAHEFLARYDSSKNSQGITPKERAKWGWVGFFGDFRPICRHISRTVHFRHNVTMGR